MKSFIEKWQKGKTENRLYHSVCIFSNIKQLIERWRLNNQEWQIYHEVNISLFLHLCIQSISLLPCYYLSLLFACNVSPPPPTPPLHAVIRAERSVIRPSEADQPTLNISHNFKWAHMNHRSQAALVSVFVCVCVCGCMCVCVLRCSNLELLLITSGCLSQWGGLMWNLDPTVPVAHRRRNERPFIIGRDGRMMKQSVRDENSACFSSALSLGLISLIPNMHQKSKHHKNL